jgi:hypothetical protein
MGWMKWAARKDFEYKGVPIVGDGHIESPTVPVTPRSLYLAQLRDRLGEKALRAVATPEQLRGMIFQRPGGKRTKSLLTPAPAPKRVEPDPDLTAALQAAITAGVGAGEQKTVYINFNGGVERATLISADEDGLRVTMRGLEVDIAWAKVDPARLLGIARKYCDDTEVLEAYRVTAGLVDEGD